MQGLDSKTFVEPLFNDTLFWKTSTYQVPILVAVINTSGRLKCCLMLGHIWESTLGQMLHVRVAKYAQTIHSSKCPKLYWCIMMLHMLNPAFCPTKCHFKLLRHTGCRYVYQEVKQKFCIILIKNLLFWSLFLGRE